MSPERILDAQRSPRRRADGSVDLRVRPPSSDEPVRRLAAFAFLLHAIVSVLGYMGLLPWGELTDEDRYRAIAAALGGDWSLIWSVDLAMREQAWCAIHSPTGYGAIVRALGEGAARLLVALTAPAAVLAVARLSDFFRASTLAGRVAAGIVALWPVSLWYAGSLTPSVIHAHLFVVALTLFVVGAAGQSRRLLASGALVFAVCATLRPSASLALLCMGGILAFVPRRPVSRHWRVGAFALCAVPIFAAVHAALPFSGDYSGLMRANGALVDVSRADAIFRAICPMLFVRKIGHAAMLAYLLLAARGSWRIYVSTGRPHLPVIAWSLWAACIAAAYLDPLSALRMELPAQIILAPLVGVAVSDIRGRSFGVGRSGLRRRGRS